MLWGGAKMFNILLGIVGLILILCLLAKEFKVAGLVFIIAMLIVPLASCEDRAIAKRNYNKAIVAMKEQDYDKALELLNKAIKKDENHLEAREKKNYIEAIKLVEKGNEKYLKEDFIGARKDIEKALALYSDIQEAKDLLVLIEEREQEIQQEKEARKQEEENENWSTENTIGKIISNLELPRGVDFTLLGHFGNHIYKADSTDGPSNMQDPYVINLSFIKSGLLSNSQLTDRELMKEVAFRVSHLIHKNEDKIDFNIASVRIIFPNPKNEQGVGGHNFAIGINTIREYFKKPRSEKAGISSATGKVVTVDFCYESFYEFIEDNFTLPENMELLLEDEAWTTISKRAIP